MAKKKIEYFNCPSCGNELMKSDCNCITCHWCKTRIVPEGYRKKEQHTEIYAETKTYKEYLGRKCVKNEKREKQR